MRSYFFQNCTEFALQIKRPRIVVNRSSLISWVLGIFDAMIPWEVLLELIGALMGLMYILLLAQKKTSAWVYGIVSCGMFGIICFLQGYTGQGIIQTINAFMGFYGLWFWKNHPKESQSWPKLFIATLILLPGLYFASLWLFHTSNMAFHLDNVALILSIVATLLTVKVVLENWYFWLIINVITALTAMNNHLFFLACVSIGYFLLSLYGIFQWKKASSNRVT